MKKILSFLTSAILIASICLHTVSAQDTHQLQTNNKNPLDLSDLYNGDDEIKKIFEEYKKLTLDIFQYKGILTDKDSLKSALKINDKLEELNEKINKLYIYAEILNYIDCTDKESERITDLVNSEYMKTYDISFLTEEISAFPDDYKKILLESEDFADHHDYLKYLFEEKPNPSSSSISSAKEIQACKDKYDELRRVSQNQSDKESHIAQTIQKYAENYMNFAKAWTEYAKANGYSSVLDMNFSNNNTSNILYDNLSSSAFNNLESAHRYMNLVYDIGYHGKDWIISGNIPEGKGFSANYPYEQADDIIKNALSPLGTEYISELQKAFDQNWIDYVPRENKVLNECTTIFSNTAYPFETISHPFVFVNYTDDYISLDNLAHELGHAVITNRNYENKTEKASTFISETAATLNERLLADHMIKNAVTKDEKLYYLFQELYNLYTYYWSSTADNSFEHFVYQTVQNGGTLSAEQLQNKYIELMSNYDGLPAENHSSLKNAWTQLGNLYSQPYYNYQYTAAVSAACKIADDISAGKQGTAENYIKFLNSKDMKNTHELYKIIGIGIDSPDFTKAYMNRYNRIIDEIRQLLD